MGSVVMSVHSIINIFLNDLAIVSFLCVDIVCSRIFSSLGFLEKIIKYAAL